MSPATPDALAAWIARLPAGLQPAVRQRVDGERTPLPGPVLAPYLVGLLVLLGMLGTFLGMVITFKGAMFALETSSSLESIRSALAVPIQGLGLSFGTSIAGVAASAILGLLSAMSRRERLEAARLLALGQRALEEGRLQAAESAFQKGIALAETNRALYYAGAARAAHRLGAKDRRAWIYLPGQRRTAFDGL